VTDTDDIRDAYDLPAEFRLADAAHMDRVEAADGTPFRALVSPAGGTRALVHEDVAVYDGVYDHPVTTGLIGLLLVGGIFAGLLGATYALAASVGSALATVGVGLGGVVGSWVASNLLLYRTLAGEWLFRFLDWNEHKELILIERRGT
jgi:hypothetical protein